MATLADAVGPCDEDAGYCELASVAAYDPASGTVLSLVTSRADDSAAYVTLYRGAAGSDPGLPGEVVHEAVLESPEDATALREVLAEYAGLGVLPDRIQELGDERRFELAYPALATLGGELAGSALWAESGPDGIALHLFRVDGTSRSILARRPSVVLPCDGGAPCVPRDSVGPEDEIDGELCEDGVSLCAAGVTVEHVFVAPDGTFVVFGFYVGIPDGEQAVVWVVPTPR